VTTVAFTTFKSESRQHNDGKRSRKVIARAVLTRGLPSPEGGAYHPRQFPILVHLPLPGSQAPRYLRLIPDNSRVHQPLSFDVAVLVQTRLYNGEIRCKDNNPGGLDLTGCVSTPNLK